MKEIIKDVVIAAIIAIIVIQFIRPTVVKESSMEATLFENNYIFLNKQAYTFGEPERGDIVVFRYPDDESEIYVKRVIGLPGDTIDIEDGKIYINGSTEPLQEDYLKEEWTVATGPYTFEVPEGSYFMMGDNRNDSWDARYWSNTYVAKDKILGKAIFTYWPFAHFGKLE